MAAARILRSALFYLTFYTGSVFVVLASLAALLASRETFRRRVDSWSLWHRWCARNLVGIWIVVEGALPPGPVFVAMKHESFFEAIDIPQVVAFPGIFAKAELMRIPLWGTVADRYGLVEVQREQGARALRHMMAAAKKIIGEGRSLFIFPEGTRVQHGTRVPLQAGFAGIYKLLGLPVVAIAVDTGPLYHRWIKLPGTITYRISDPIPPGLPRAEIEQRVGAAINALNSQ
ncbi:lysophospholipid acyltransferase family protein [Novosphingobium sp.]|uniref:lysophospholipid acyltransferase family protein n=1 Tax=Novosphingobium sp. TaxID=1874826 RepID=UPI00286BA108|nr:lysophospholipid acyltransferase family protein [Novosphingobium sp.]